MLICIKCLYFNLFCCCVLLLCVVVVCCCVLLSVCCCLCLAAYVMLLVCVRVVCVGDLLRYGKCTSAPIFTCADIAHTCDGFGFDSTSQARINIARSLTGES